MNLNRLFKSASYYDFENEGLTHKLPYYFALILFFGLYALNIYWYKFMLRRLSQVIWPPEDKVWEDMKKKEK